MLFDDEKRRRKVNVLGMQDAILLKREMQERFGCRVHFHDACGAQSLSLDAPADDAVSAYLLDFCRARGLTIDFSPDRTILSIGG